MNFREYFESTAGLVIDSRVSKFVNSSDHNPAGLKIGDSVVLSHSDDDLRYSNFRGGGSGYENGKLVDFRLSGGDHGQLMGYVKFRNSSYWVVVSSLEKSSFGRSVKNLVGRVMNKGVSNPFGIGVNDVVYVPSDEDLRSVIGRYNVSAYKRPARVERMRKGSDGLEALIKFSGYTDVYDSRGSFGEVWVKLGILKKLVVGREGELYHTR